MSRGFRDAPSLDKASTQDKETNNKSQNKPSYRFHSYFMGVVRVFIYAPPAPVLVVTVRVAFAVIIISISQPECAWSSHKKASRFGAQIADVSGRLQRIPKALSAYAPQLATIHLGIVVFAPQVPLTRCPPS
jgi:hypothetical protein